jgi:hypothetical protein
MLEDALPKGMKGGLRTVAGSHSQFDREYWVTLAHGEVGPRASVVEYEVHIFGLALAVVSIVNGHRDAESTVGPVFDERRPRVCVMRGVVDDNLVSTGYYDRGSG